MAAGKSGSLPSYYQTNAYYPQYGGMYIRPHYVEEYDAAGNYSIVKIDYIEFTSSMYSQSVSWSGSVKININGTEYHVGTSFSTAGYTATKWPCSIVSDKIYHNDSDGTKTITISLTYAYTASGQVGAVWTNSGILSTATVALTTIPRLSVLSAGNGTLGTSMTLKVARKSSAYSHNILYRCGDVEEYIVIHSSETSVLWTPPISLASQNTTGTSVAVELVIGTLLPDMTWIGNETLTISCAIPSSVGLTVSDGWVTVQPYNDGTAASAVDAFVQGYSKAKVTFDASKISTVDAYGAQIAGYHIVYNKTAYQSPYRTPVLTASGTNSVTCTVTDTRGRTVSETLSFAVEAYKKPTLSEISVFRCNSSGEATDEGTYVSVTAKGNVSEIGGLNSQTMQCELGNLASATLESGVTKILGGGAVSITSTYTVKLTLTDKLGNTATYKQLIPTADVMFHARAGGKGAAFGKYAEADDLLDVAWSAKIRKSLEVLKDLVIKGAATITGALSVGGKLTAASADIDGRVTAGGIDCGYITGPGNIELGRNLTSANGHGGYIDFHYNGSTSDYTSRIIEHSEGWININAKNGVLANGINLTASRVLWSGALWMNAGHTITFAEKISQQSHGAVFAFSPYSDGTALNSDFNFFFVPKAHITYHSGCGVDFLMKSGVFSRVGAKYIYVADNRATGHELNETAGTANGITYDNTKWVLRYVIGV